MCPVPPSSRPHPGGWPLAARLRALPPSCGPVRLVGVDGHAGSGKSTLAGRLSEWLGDAPVVHLDEVANHEEFFAWPARLCQQLLQPLRRGEPATVEVYDWERRAYTGVRTVPPAPVVLVEGVGAGRRALRPHLAHLLWLEVDRHTAWRRGRRRDGPGLTAFWDVWTRAEAEHFAGDPSRPYADLLVRPCPTAPEGYQVLRGPATGDSP